MSALDQAQRLGAPSLLPLCGCIVQSGMVSQKAEFICAQSVLTHSGLGFFVF